MRRRTIQHAITGGAVLIAVVAVASVAGVGTTSSNQITSADIKDGTIRTADLADDSVGAAKTKDALRRRLSGSSNASTDRVWLAPSGAPGSTNFDVPLAGGLGVDTLPGELVVARAELNMSSSDPSENGTRAHCILRLRTDAGEVKDDRIVSVVNGSMQASFMAVTTADGDYASALVECGPTKGPGKSETGTVTTFIESMRRTDRSNLLANTMPLRS